MHLLHRLSGQGVPIQPALKRAIDDQLDQFGAEKVGCRGPEGFEKVGVNRSGRQQSAEVVGARDTK